MSIEAMKRALEALALFASDESDEGQMAIAAHEALRQAIERAEKQKPVAWSVLDKRTGKHWYTHESRYTSQYYASQYSHRESDNTPSMIVTPLYTEPPQREWVELTDEDVTELFCDYDGSQFPAFVRAIEAKLKEKNHVS